MSFRDEILSGDTLIRNAIQSEGYVAGVAGWRISRDGDADFNDVSVRGELLVQGDDPDAHVRVYELSSIVGPIVEITSVLGEAWSLSTFPHDILKIGPEGPTDAHIYFTKSPERNIVFSAGAAGQIVFENSTGFIKKATDSGSGVFPAVNWANVPFGAGYASAAGTPCQYKLFPDGMVRCRGIVDATANPIPGGSVIFTFPAGFRPVQACYFDAVFDSSAVRGRYLVRANGNVELYEAPNDKPALESIQFSVI